MVSSTGDRPTDPDVLTVEAWGQGFMVGALVIMIAITVANMKKGVFLHKLIVTELVLAVGHGTFIFSHNPVYGWHLSVSAIGLNISWSLHNLIAWVKIRGFFTPWNTRIYLVSLLLAQVYWILEIYANFAFFNDEPPFFSPPGLSSHCSATRGGSLPVASSYTQFSAATTVHYPSSFVLVLGSASCFFSWRCPFSRQSWIRVRCLEHTTWAFPRALSLSGS